MPVTLNSGRNRRKARKPINVHQNKFGKGYISTIDNSRRPLDSLSDLTNMEVVQDNVLRPRPPLAEYGTQPTLDVVGRAMTRYNGTRSIFWMMDDSGTGKLYRQTDGGAYTLVGGTYDSAAWAEGVQAKNKLYVYNGVDNLSYVSLATNTISTYTALATPGAPTVTMTGANSTGYNYYYKITANNEVGESIASTAGTDTTNKLREAWIENTDYMVLTWSSVPNATSYTIYVGDSAANCYELFTTTALTFTDYGTIAPNTFKLAPEGNSTEGAVFKHMYVDARNSQIFGITDDNKLYYSAPISDDSADFSPYAGGGYVSIDENGDTELNYVTGFRNGKGDPVITVSARGAAGKGKLYHLTFDSLTVGDQIIIYPNVTEANGQSGTYAPRATIKARDSITYPTGADFKSTGTSQNIVNILTTNTISQVIEPDVENISLENLHKAVGVEYKDRLYFALPVGSTENNQIWYLDFSRKNLWVLRWNVAAKDMWLYEDSNGRTHFCVLVDNKVLEFSRAGIQTHQDNGTAWSSRVGFSSLVWDEDGIILGKIRNQYYKLLNPKGTIVASATAYNRLGISTAAGSDTFTVTTTPTAYDDWPYDLYAYDTDPGAVSSYGKPVSVLKVKPKGLVSQLDWEVTANTAGTDYILSAVNTRGTALDELIIKT